MAKRNKVSKTRKAKFEADEKLSPLYDKLHNLKIKLGKCASPDGTARYSKMIHQTERDIIAKGGNL